MTKCFCDVCEKPMSEPSVTSYMKAYTLGKFTVYFRFGLTGKGPGHGDICWDCAAKIVKDGPLHLDEANRQAAADTKAISDARESGAHRERMSRIGRSFSDA